MFIYLTVFSYCTVEEYNNFLKKLRTFKTPNRLYLKELIIYFVEDFMAYSKNTKIEVLQNLSCHLDLNVFLRNFRAEIVRFLMSVPKNCRFFYRKITCVRWAKYFLLIHSANPQ